MIRSIARLTATIGAHTGISFFNALLEMYVAIRSMGTYVWWIMNFCTMEYTVEDEDGTIIHHFPQLNNGDDNDF